MPSSKDKPVRQTSVPLDQSKRKKARKQAASSAPRTPAAKHPLKSQHQREASPEQSLAAPTPPVASASASLEAATPALRRRTVPFLLLGGSFIGFAVATYLTFAHYRGTIVPCQVVTGCEEVQKSAYSEILGIPVALLGTLFFATMFYLAIALLTADRPLVVKVYKVSAFLGALAVIPFFLIQALVLKAFCSYCLLTEVMLLAMWGGSFALRSPSTGERADQPVAMKQVEAIEHPN